MFRAGYLYVAALLLLLASLAAKSLLFVGNPLPDDMRLGRDIAASMQSAGYQTKIGGKSSWSQPMVEAQQGHCRVRLRDVTVFGPDFAAIARLRLNDGLPVRLAQNGSYLSDYPRFAAEFSFRGQRELGRIGLMFPISPVIAIGARDGCWPEAGILRDVRMHLMVK